MSLGEFIGRMQEMGMKFKHLGIVARLGTLRNLVFKFLEIQNPPKNHETWHGLMTWHQHAAVIFFGRIGTSFGVSFLRTGASLKKARGSERERVTSVCETTYVHCLLPP